MLKKFESWLREQLEKFESWLREIANLWLFAFIAILSFILFSGLGLDQVLDVYRAFDLNQQKKLPTIIISYLSILLLSWVLFLSFFSFLKADEKDNEKKNLSKFFGFFFILAPLWSLVLGLDRADLSEAIKFFLPLTCVFSIILIFYFCFNPTWLDKMVNKYHYYGSLLFSLFIVLLSPFFVNNSSKSDITTFFVSFLLSVAFYYFLMLPMCFQINFGDKFYYFLVPLVVPFGLIVIIFTAPTSISDLIAFVTEKVDITTLLGPINSIAFFIVILLSLVYPFYHEGYRIKRQNTAFVLIVLPVILAFVFSGFNWNDNHQIRQLSSSSGNQMQTLELKSAFEKWWEERDEERKLFESNDKPYPIYIVSAQGGGIFAAYHSALTLSRLQDLSPNFANHVFAISAVSGGSLGATVFSSLVKTKLPKLEEKAAQLLNKDFLSPLLVVALYPDFIQRFIPFRLESLDRARGLEYSFEQAWKETDPNPLEKSYYEHWSPKNAAPALVLNTTVVETGDRLVLSPFKINFPNLKDIRTVACKNDGKDIDLPLSTAAVISARFPLVTPVGWFNRCNKDENGNDIKDKNGNKKEIITRLADGGYFENSGFSTAWEIGQRIKKILADKKVGNVKVVYLALTNNDHLESNNSGGLNELLSPILAMYNSREAKGRSIIEQAEYQIDENRGINNSSDLKYHNFRQFYLTHANGNTPVTSSPNTDENSKRPKLPLGWYLSKTSQEAISARIGNPDACTDDAQNNSANNNDCVMRSIKEELY